MAPLESEPVKRMCRLSAAEYRITPYESGDDVCVPNPCEKELLLRGGPLDQGILFPREKRLSGKLFFHSFESLLSLCLFFRIQTSSVDTSPDGALLGLETFSPRFRRSVQGHLFLLTNTASGLRFDLEIIYQI